MYIGDKWDGQLPRAANITTYMTRLECIRKTKLHMPYKRKVYNECVFPIMAWTWDMNTDQASGKEVKKCPTRNEEINALAQKNWKWTRVDELKQDKALKKWPWAGHLCRRHVERWTKSDRLKKKRYKRTRGVGRQLNRWCDDMMEITEQQHWNCTLEALDRSV